MGDEQAVIDGLYAKYNLNGFVTEDDIFDLCTEYDLPLHRIDYVCDKIISMGALISDKHNAESNEDEIYTYSQYDYDTMYKKCIDVCPEMRYIIDQIKTFPLPQRGDAKRLIIQARSGNVFARNYLIEIYMRVALRIAMQFNDKTDIPLEDLFSAACFSLIKCVDSYDYSEHGYFINFISFRITHHIERYIADNDSLIRIPVYLYNNVEKFTFISFDDIIESSDLCNNDYEKMIEGAELNEIKEMINKVLNTLSEKESNIIQLRFGFIDDKCYTLEEIGKYYNVTRERVRQIELKAIRRMKHPSRGKKLEEYWKE